MSASLARVEEGKLILSFHHGQAETWRCDRRFILMLAGSQAGKTTFGPFWLHREIQRCGPGDYLCVSASFDLYKLKLLPALKEVFEGLLRCGRFWSGDRLLELADPDGKFWANRADDRMWGRVILRSAAAEGGLESSTARAAWLDEAGLDEFGIDSWFAVLRRLALAQGRVLVTTTPYNLGWLKSELYDRWVAGDPTVGVVQFDSLENPLFPREEFERARATMPAWRFKMAYQGQFSRPAGLVYDCFSELNVCDPFALPNEWPRYVGVDPGGVNLALVWLAHDPQTKRHFLYREQLSGGQTTAEHVRKARDLEATDGASVRSWWGGAGSEDQFRADWTYAGIRVEKPPVKDVEAGIDRVTALIKSRLLFVFRSCSGILDEFGSYRRVLDAAGEPTEAIEEKRKFHRLDALRYVATGLAGDPGDNPLSGIFSFGKAKLRSPSPKPLYRLYGSGPARR